MAKPMMNACCASSTAYAGMAFPARIDGARSEVARSRSHVRPSRSVRIALPEMLRASSENVTRVAITAC